MDDNDNDIGGGARDVARDGERVKVPLDYVDPAELRYREAVQLISKVARADYLEQLAARRANGGRRARNDDEV